MTSLVRTLLWMASTAVAGGIALWVMDWILEDFSVGGWTDLVFAAITISVTLAIIFPFAFRFSASIHPLLFPVLIFVISGLLVSFTGKIDDWLDRGSIEIANLETAIWIALGVTMIVAFMGTLFSLDDTNTYHRLVTDSLLASNRGVKTEEPGFMFVELDGLSKPVLELAIANDYMPYLKSKIDSGEYQITGWETDLSSQTSASQAGLLLGNNFGIPAFRWWDKPEQMLFVSSSPKTASRLEEKLYQGTGLLEPDGASRFNVFTGGAADIVGTFADLSLTSGGSNKYFAYLANPYTLGRILSLSIQDIFREWWEEFRQKQKGVQPFLNRPITYCLTRTGTTAAMFEASRFMITADIVAGVPSAYHLILGYDEMAHHTGLDDPYTLKFLKRVDHMLKSLDYPIEKAPRPFELIILSDHGQSKGATFKQRYNESFAEVVQSLVAGEVQLTAILDSQESTQHMTATLSEVGGDSKTAQLASRALESASRGSIEAKDKMDEKVGELGENQGYVLASGNLGLISFTEWPERMTREEIDRAFPRLIKGLVEHPGIGLVMVHSNSDGAVVYGKAGNYYLAEDRVTGGNPLANYGERAAYHFRRHDSMPNCPDLLVVSTYWPEENQVAALEELIGSHGGLGGWQQQPFVMHPAKYSTGDELIVGPGALNEVMRGWIESEQVARRKESPTDLISNGALDAATVDSQPATELL